MGDTLPLGGTSPVHLNTGGFGIGGTSYATGGALAMNCVPSTAVASPTGGAPGSAPAPCTGMLTFGGTPILKTGFALDVAAADLNGDHKPDLVFVNLNSSSVSVLLGNGDGTFSAHVDYPTAASPWAVSIADLNADGRLDLAVANNKAGSVSVMLGNGDGHVRGSRGLPQLRVAKGRRCWRSQR
jgi:hypothetical protein